MRDMRESRDRRRSRRCPRCRLRRSRITALRRREPRRSCATTSLRTRRCGEATGNTPARPARAAGDTARLPVRPAPCATRTRLDAASSWPNLRQPTRSMLLLHRGAISPSLVPRFGCPTRISARFVSVPLRAGCGVVAATVTAATPRVAPLGTEPALGRSLVVCGAMRGAD